MSLLSLRKHNLQSQTVKRLRHKTRQIDADKFIEQANLYANGQSDNVIPFQPNDSHSETNIAAKKTAKQTEKQGEQNDEQHIALERVSTTKAAKQPYRRATFTLSESCIDRLSHHAQQQQCAKSHLIRMLIRYFDHLPPKQQKLLLEQQKDR